MLNVAIVGAGNVGKIRSDVIRRSSLSRVQIVTDVDEARASALASSVGANATTDWSAAVRSPKIDVVVVSTPTKFHAQIVKGALEAGKHVLCEKPLARSATEAREVIALAKENGLVLKTGFNYRYMDHVSKAKELLESELLGPLYFLRCRYGHGGKPGYENHWCTDLDLSGGGALLEQGIHIVDLVRYLLGEPTQVLAFAGRFFWNFAAVEDNCFLLLKTKSSQTAQIHVSWTQWINIFSLELFGRDGYLELSGRDGHYGPQRVLWGKRRPDHGRPEEQVFEFTAPDLSWEREWTEFLDVIGGHGRPMGTPADSLRALQLVEAAYQSSRDEAWVQVQE